MTPLLPLSRLCSAHYYLQGGLSLAVFARCIVDSTLILTPLGPFLSSKALQDSFEPTHLPPSDRRLTPSICPVPRWSMAVECFETFAYAPDSLPIPF